MNDQILFDNYLLLLKSTVEVFIHGTLESVNLTVRDLLQDSLNTILECQSCTYQLMTDQGWYTIENVKSKDVAKILTKVSNS